MKLSFKLDVLLSQHFTPGAVALVALVVGGRQLALVTALEMVLPEFCTQKNEMVSSSIASF